MNQSADRPDERDGRNREERPDDEFEHGASGGRQQDVGADLEEGEAEAGVEEPAREPESVGEDSPVAHLQRELEEQRDKYLRLAAEYDNFRKRTQRERLDAGTRAQADIVRQMLEGLDDLTRFGDLDPEVTDAATVVEGVQMVDKKLEKALSAAGLEILDPVDQPFDPNLHEAVATEPALSPEDDNMIARVYQRGYVFKGQLIRPARVVVKQWND